MPKYYVILKPYRIATPTIEQAPVYGSVSVNLDGTISYFPNQHYYGLDEFSYNIYDEKGQCGSAKVDLVVEEVVRTLPTLYDDLVSAYAAVATTIEVLINDITPNELALNHSCGNASI